MPYIKEREEPFARMRRLLLGYGFSGPKLAAILDVSAPTAKRRLEQPETITLRDLDRINRFGHIPLEELREAVQR